jgi:hypothetical protein
VEKKKNEALDHGEREREREREFELRFETRELESLKHI